MTAEGTGDDRGLRWWHELQQPLRILRLLQLAVGGVDTPLFHQPRHCPNGSDHSRRLGKILSIRRGIKFYFYLFLIDFLLAQRVREQRQRHALP